ncbi:hypothetical protein [Hydrotalea sp.]|uniref:hypothetical protein n=1 Tax=Hydrotalea sp. TaxID=2881279 RepID=UPI00263418AD|nr:hypothetical protein [Hydrotalea sp.]
MKSYFTFFLLIFMVSCSKENNSPSNTSSNQQFPDKVGNHWVYKYNDGSNSEQYIFVDIVGTGILPDGQNVTIWTSTLQDATNRKYLLDSFFVVVDEQKAVFYGVPCLTCTTQMPDEKRRYIFPLQVNNKWFTDKFFGDTTKVLNENSLTVPAGTFDSTFELSKTVGYAVNSFTKDTIWLTPNIGMTKFYQNEYSLGQLPGNGIWELLSYQLK